MPRIDCKSCTFFGSCNKEMKKRLRLCWEFDTVCPDCGGDLVRTYRSYTGQLELTRATFMCKACDSMFEINAIPVEVDDEGAI